MSFRPLSLILTVAFGLSAPIHAAAERFFRPEAGFTRAQDLPEDARFRVRSIRIDVKDAFEGSAAHTRWERWGFDLLDRVHIETRPSAVRNRLLFRDGEATDKMRLLESEKALRSEDFLADAVLEAGPETEGMRDVKVTVYDQWTTVLAAAVAIQRLTLSDIGGSHYGKLLDEWWAGAFEHNLMGTGTDMGGMYRHDEIRNSLEMVLGNNAVTSHRLQADAYAALLSDGRAVHLGLAKPLLSREDRNGFLAYLASQKSSQQLYLDANELDRLPAEAAQNAAGSKHVVRTYVGYVSDSLQLAYVRSFGSATKLDAGPTFEWYDRHPEGGLGEADTALLAYLPPPPDAPETRTDALIGFETSFYRYAYATARNFRNLKWNETVRTGWKLRNRIGINQAWMGADGPRFHLEHEALYGGAWRGTWYLNCSTSVAYFPRLRGAQEGRLDAAWEGQWKPVRLTATSLSAGWTSLFDTPASRQLVLGAKEGLSGYPTFYYSGQARFLAVAEQRCFPEWEFLTLVPAFTGFLTAGNTYPSWRDFEAGDLHYGAGLGLRLGKSRSTTKGVQHFNISWPLGDKYVTGPVFSVLVKRSL